MTVGDGEWDRCGSAIFCYLCSRRAAKTFRLSVRSRRKVRYARREKNIKTKKRYNRPVTK